MFRELLEFIIAVKESMRKAFFEVMECQGYKRGLIYNLSEGLMRTQSLIIQVMFMRLNCIMEGDEGIFPLANVTSGWDPLLQSKKLIHRPPLGRRQPGSL